MIFEDDEYIYDDECECDVCRELRESGEDLQYIGNIYCPASGCYCFEFTQHSEIYVECVECGTMYNLEKEELPFVTYEEIEKCGDN